MAAINPPHSRTISLQLALADHLNNATGIDWRSFSDTLQVPKSGALNYSALVSFTHKSGDLVNGHYRVQTRLRCAGKTNRIVDESLGDWIDYLDERLLKCIRIDGTFRSVQLNCNLRLDPESDWVISIQENQDTGALGTIVRRWLLALD